MIWKMLLELHGFCGSDMAGDKDTCKTANEYVFIFASVQLQRIIKLSMTEAEYIVPIETFKEHMAGTPLQYA